MTKWIIAKETLLAYLDFHKPFQIYTDVSHDQLGAGVSQEGNPIAFPWPEVEPSSDAVCHYRQGTAEHSRDPQGMSQHTPWKKY